MNDERDRGDGERAHLLVIRVLVYSGAVLLLATPISTWVGTASAIAAAVGALLAVHRLPPRVRLALPLVLGCMAIILGLGVDSLLGTWRLPAELLGISATLYGLEGLTFGLVAFGATVILRTLAARVPVLAALEAAMVVAAVTVTFAAHRDQRFGQPRFLADWSLARGCDPVLTLVTIGLAALGSTALLQQRRQSGTKTLAVGLALLLLAGLGAGAIWGVPHGAWRQTRRILPPPVSDDPPGEDEPGKPVAVVLLHDEYRPYEPYWYFRQAACSYYNGRRLVGAVSPGIDTDVPAEFPAGPVTLPGLAVNEEWHQRVTTTVNLLQDQSRPTALTSPLTLQPTANPDPSVFCQSYRVSSRVLSGSEGDLYVRLGRLQGGDPNWTEERRAHYLACPPDPRYRQLAAEILRGFDETALREDYQGSPLLRALVVKQWIEEHTTYTKRPGHPEGSDPVAEFLFGSRRGYCVHIAHSMATLLRSLGIPARVATGYAVPAQRAGRSSAVIILTSDSHAWPEIYLEGAGWVVVDAAPRRRDARERESQEPDLASMQWLAERARRKPPVERLANAAARPELAFAWLWVAVPLLSGLYAVKLWRRVSPYWSGPRHRYRRCYRCVLDRLAELGLVRRFGETREQFAARLYPLVPAFMPLTDAHLQRAVGGASNDERAGWLHLMQQACQGVRTAFPRWRRWLGVLDPLSWFRVR